MLGPLEWWAAGLTLLAIFFIYEMEASGLRLDREVRLATKDHWLFAGHVALIGVLIAGLRRTAAGLAGVIMILTTLAGLGACINAAIGKPDAAAGAGMLALVQILIFWVCQRSARDDAGPRFAFEPPRLALGALVAAAAWVGIGAGLRQLDAPRLAEEQRLQAEAARQRVGQTARARFYQLADCLQRVPAGADSQPLYPATLAELAHEGCAAAAGPPPDGWSLEYSPGAADSAGGRHQFTLAFREQPPIDGGSGFKLDESFRPTSWTSGRNGDAGLQQLPLSALAAAGRCVEAARDSATGRYPASLAEMQRLHPCELRMPADSSTLVISVYGASYVVRYTPPAAVGGPDALGGYLLSAEPRPDVDPASRGFASFLIDSAGRIHTTLRPRAATASDPVIPDCPDDFRGRATMGRCNEYRLRQRWGLRPELPTLAWSISGDGTVPTGDTLYVIPTFRGYTAKDTVVEARVRWSADGRDSVIRADASAIGEPYADATIFRLKHVYHDTGYKEIRFSVRTRGREIYEKRDSVRVLVGWRRR